MPKAYYNEIDLFCCEWLRNLIDAGLIPPGDCDGLSTCRTSRSSNSSTSPIGRSKKLLAHIYPHSAGFTQLAAPGNHPKTAKSPTDTPTGRFFVPLTCTEPPKGGCLFRCCVGERG
jgi:hypothetical protein